MMATIVIFVLFVGIMINALIFVGVVAGFLKCKEVLVKGPKGHEDS